MLKLSSVALLVGSLVLCFPTFAQVTTEKFSFPPVAWTSQSPSDIVTIENGTGANLIIHITVNGGTDAGGINVRNCGATTRINAGSSAVCATKDPASPVNFNTDGPNAATGTYQVRQPN